ncbi:HigA family addiction module antitoxin [uncultured Rhodospira sp.]|uniref:HigA family addiction module antitoxin n=1 Tax=uncultured Rhodospira sp. TaxID=1936189 RepID=UPI002605DF5F|nr:HigA family addiction module antitoxin [uncultured Rhodospira sp.]
MPEELPEELILSGRPRRCPSHPGLVLRDTVLPALRLSVTAAARELGVSRQTLHRILAGEVAVTPAMAVRLGHWCGNGPEVWLRMQQAHDLWIAARDLEDDLTRIPRHTDAVA